MTTIQEHRNQLVELLDYIQSPRIHPYKKSPSIFADTLILPEVPDNIILIDRDGGYTELDTGSRCDMLNLFYLVFGYYFPNLTISHGENHRMYIYGATPNDTPFLIAPEHDHNHIITVIINIINYFEC